MKRSGALLVGGVLALSACKSPSSATPADGPAATPEAETASPSSGGAPGTGDEAEDATMAALERVPQVLDGVAAVRKLAFKAPIGAGRQSTEEFRQYVQAELDKELPPEKSAEMSKALFHAGFLAEPVDLRDTLTTALVSQVGAYYDPTKEHFYVVMASKQPMLADTINAHELTHGLQDQHFDRETYVGEGDQKGKVVYASDELTARRFVVEGEATLVMTAYQVFAMGQGAMLLENEQMTPMLDQQMAQTEKTGLGQLLSMNAEQTEAQMKMMGDDFAKAAEALDELPPYITAPLMVPYLRGMTAVYRVYRAGGWDAVNALYAKPPTSTEQVLHPVEKLITKRDEPIALHIDTKTPVLASWTVVEDDTVGELMWQVYFSLWGIPELEPAAGWGGDQVVYLSNGDEQLALFATTWDTAEDARQFHEAYAASLGKRFEGVQASAASTTTSVQRGTNAYVTVVRKGKNVAIVDGADPKIGKKMAQVVLKAKRG